MAQEVRNDLPLKNISWFEQARFGMFIHYGAYSVAGRSEWVIDREQIPYPEYIQKYASQFKAEKYNPEEWVALAKKAGMKYMVLTAKHLDGYCLWETRTTSFNTVQIGPGRDLVRPFVEAVRKGGLKVGLYFCIPDLSRPEYYNREKDNFQSFNNFYRAQLRELLTGYGTIDILWLDAGNSLKFEGEQVYKLAKSLQPSILINDRSGDKRFVDYQTCEFEIKPAPAGIAWEKCEKTNEHWGYHADDFEYKNPKQIIRTLVRVAASGGNLLLNVGPKADGTFPPEYEPIFKDVGSWLSKNGEAIYGSERSPFTWHVTSWKTVKTNRIYIHFFHSPGNEYVDANIANKIISVYYLATGKPIKFRKEGQRLILSGLNFSEKNGIATTIVVEVEGEPKAAPLADLEGFTG